MLFFTILGIFAIFLLCAGASLVGVTMSYARPYRYSGWSSSSPTPKTAVVMVAREDIPAKAMIASPEAKFRVRLYRIGEEPSDAATDYNQIRGMVLTRALHKGEVCTVGHLQNQTVAVPEGKRALSFRTTLPFNDMRFLVVGSHVDVTGQMPVNDLGQGGMGILALDSLVLALNR